MPARPRVLVAIAMHPDARARLQAVADVESWPADLRGLREVIRGYDGLIVYSARFDRDVFSEARRLKVMSCHSYAEELLAAATQRGIRVTCVPSLWDTVADMALALIFSAARMIPQAHAAVKAGLWGRGDLKVGFSGYDVFRKTLGIAGLGRIGAALARRVQGFEMRILYCDIVRKPELERELHLEYRTLEQLLAEADIVSIQLPLREETRGLIGEREFRLMKPDAILVNTARGAILDERALCRALQERWIAAAGLDVYAEEPIRADSPLLTLENVVLAPHLGGSTKECDLVLVEDTIRVLTGQEPLHPVN